MTNIPFGKNVYQKYQKQLDSYAETERFNAIPMVKMHIPLFNRNMQTRIFCNNTCPSGSYGPRCGGNCSLMCSNEECDHVYGCSIKEGTSIPTATSSIS